MVSQNLLNIVDTAMVGFLGDAALAAVGLGGFVVFACQALILGVSTGVQTLAARRKGEGLRDRAALVLNSALVLVVIVAPLLSLALTQLAGPVYPYLNDDPDVLDLFELDLDWDTTFFTAEGPVGCCGVRFEENIAYSEVGAG